jgi:anti-sigma-K factor RskA
MKPSPTAIAERVEDLLMKRALSGLTEDESQELRSCTSEADESFDLAVAALDLATLPAEPMPAAVAAKLLTAAEQQLMVAALPRKPPQNRSRRAGVSFGWLAAVVLLVFVGGVWWSARRPLPQIVYVPVAPTVPLPPTPTEERAKFLADHRDVKKLDWTATADPVARGASGDVVWSPSAQRGYMRFVGIAKNDRQKFQYQLWIFDKERDARYPVDGGVFDVSAAGEVIVPITTRLPIGQPTLFAVTVEAPGGVVVSARKRIVVTASST